jgi:hypothetical protein
VIPITAIAAQILSVLLIFISTFTGKRSPVTEVASCPHEQLATLVEQKSGAQHRRIDRWTNRD